MLLALLWDCTLLGRQKSLPVHQNSECWLKSWPVITPKTCRRKGKEVTYFRANIGNQGIEMTEGGAIEAIQWPRGTWHKIGCVVPSSRPTTRLATKSLGAKHSNTKFKITTSHIHPFVFEKSVFTSMFFFQRKHVIFYNEWELRSFCVN